MGRPHPSGPATGSGRISTESRPREARLRPEFANLYPGIPAGEWLPAADLGAAEEIAAALGPLRAKAFPGRSAVPVLEVRRLENPERHLASGDRAGKVFQGIVVDHQLHIGVDLQDDLVPRLRDADVVGLRQAPAVCLDPDDAAARDPRERLARSEIDHDGLGYRGKIPQAGDACLEPLHRPVTERDDG